MLRKSNPTALFNAINEQQWEKVALILNLYPNEAKMLKSVLVKDNKYPSRRYALHHAVNLKPPADIITSLIKANPKATCTKDSYYNRLPLHFACLKEASDDVIRLLLAAYPAGARSSAMYGRLPIHYICGNNSSNEMIDLIHSHYPAGVKSQDNYGLLPIHMACLQNAESRVVKKLIDLYPESVYVKTKRGNKPAECLSEIPDGKNKDTILTLLEDQESALNKIRCNVSDPSLESPVNSKQSNNFPPILVSVSSGEFC